MNSVGLPIGNKFTESEKQDYLAYQLVAMVIEIAKLNGILMAPRFIKD